MAKKSLRRVWAAYTCHEILCFFGIHALERSIEIPATTAKMHVSRIDLGGFYCPVCGYYTKTEIPNEPKEKKETIELEGFGRVNCGLLKNCSA